MSSWHLLTPVAAINLQITLCGGQCFRWRPTPRETFVGVINNNAYELYKGKIISSNNNNNISPLQQLKNHSSLLVSSNNNNNNNDALWFRCLSKELKESSAIENEVKFLHYYLSLDIDLDKLWKRWTIENPMRHHPLVRYLISHTTKDIPVYIRHLRQEIHETLISFLCSQNNNVKRITSLLEKLSTTYGYCLCYYNLNTGEVISSSQIHNSKFTETLKLSNKTKGKEKEEKGWISLNSLPSIEVLAKRTEEELKALGFGYRSKYIIECATIIRDSGSISIKKNKNVSKKNSNNFDDYYFYFYNNNNNNNNPCKCYNELLDSKLDLFQKRQKLLNLPGVGRKVADCVLLFALGYHEIVPVDTHIAQVASKYLAKVSAKKVEKEFNNNNNYYYNNNMKTNERKRSRNDNDNDDDEVIPIKGKVNNLSWETILAEWYNKSKDQKEKKNPALLPKHHDAIQTGFNYLFGDYCGWAHSILFYKRIRGVGKKLIS